MVAYDSLRNETELAMKYGSPEGQYGAHWATMKVGPAGLLQAVTLPGQSHRLKLL